MTAKEILETNLREEIGLPETAIEWLLGLWNLTQVFDDVADGGEIDRDDLDKAIWYCFVGSPTNVFYQQHQAWLVPACAQAVLKWMASDLAERRGMADERSYMWRASFYDVVCAVTALVHGPSSEKSYEALAMYGEGCAEYMREFGNA